MAKFVHNSLFGKNKSIKIAKRLSAIFLLMFKFAAYASFPWKLNRYSYGVQFGINYTPLDQSKLSNFVECTIMCESSNKRKPDHVWFVHPSTDMLMKMCQSTCQLIS